MEKKRGREGDRTCYNSWKEEQRSGRQLGDLPDKALKAIDKSCPVWRMLEVDVQIVSPIVLLSPLPLSLS